MCDTNVTLICVGDPNCDTNMPPRQATNCSWGRGSGGVKSAGVSQSVRETSRDESQSVPSSEEVFKTRVLELPIFEGSVPSCSPHSAGYTRTSLHPYFPVTNADHVLIIMTGGHGSCAPICKT